MSEIRRKGTILYFEDEELLAETLITCLTNEGYQVVHFVEFPELGLEELLSSSEEQPDIVIMDVKMPGIDGYQACENIKGNSLYEHIPVLFISGLMEAEDILKAYDVGATDYLVKPVRMKELIIKISQHVGQYRNFVLLGEQAGNARKFAFEAMATSSELGEILRFHERCSTINEISELAEALLKMITKFSLKSSALFFSGQAHYFSDDGQFRPLEEKVLNAFRDQGRIYSWKNRTFFNYNYFSVLVRNMPVEDEKRYGILKDQLCLLLNGVDGRVKSLMVEKSNEMKATTMKVAADTIAEMVMEMERDNVALSKQFDNIISDMKSDIGTELVGFNLLEHEEEILLNHLIEATNRSSNVFEASLIKEREYKEIMSRLLKKLRSD